MFGHGKDTRIYMNGWDMSNYLNSINAPRTADVAETTVFNSSGAKTYTPGNTDATLSAEGLFDGSPSSVESSLQTSLGSSAGAVWTWFPQGSGRGNYGYGVHTINNNYEIDTPVDGIVTMSVEGQSKVGRDRVESMKAMASATTSGSGTSTDNTAASTAGGVGYFQMLSSTATKTVTATVQHSSAGSSWADLVTFTASTGRKGQRVAVAGSVKRYTRGAWTLSTGGTGSPVFNIGFRRK